MDPHFISGLLLGGAVVGGLWYARYLWRTGEEWDNELARQRKRLEERVEWRGRVRDAAEKRKERSERSK